MNVKSKVDVNVKSNVDVNVKPKKDVNELSQELAQGKPTYFPLQ